MFMLISFALVLYEAVLSKFLLQCKCEVKLMGVRKIKTCIYQSTLC